VPPPGAEPGEVNVHAAWRMAVAERAARAYAGNRKLAALAVAGSVGALDPEVLTGWAARDALASRGDDLAARDLLTRAGHAVVRAVLAVNRVYLPHRQIKWQHHLITGLEVVPERLAGRLESMSASPAAEAFRATEALLEDTVLLAEAHTGADLSSFRHALAQRRRPLDPPRAGR
jgi:hypothetical protein